jgi:acetyl-CoA synthetase
MIAVRSPDPVLFLGYWNAPEATAAKFVKNWLVTGDLGTKDSDGYFWYEGREDDVISSGGYRIGPADLEDCIAKHPAVKMVAVVGRPDPVRGEIVKAFVVVGADARENDNLKQDIQSFVRDKLAAYQYPREIEFLDELPLTATGKVRRRDLRERDAGHAEAGGTT